MKQPAEDSRSASGKVLPGTISDSMIHTDRLQSEPPLLATQPKGASTPKPAASSAPEPKAGASPVPAARPSPAAT